MEFVRRIRKWFWPVTRQLLLFTSAALFAGVVISWYSSLGGPHGAMLTGVRRYGVVADRGVIQFRYETKTDIVQSGADAWSVKEVGFQQPGESRKIDFRTFGPRVVLSPWQFDGRAEVLTGGEIPEPSTGRMTPFGDHTIIHGLPHWMLALALGLPNLWYWFFYGRKRLTNQRRRAGLCIACGYDLRASPQRCPECGAANLSHAT